SRTGTPSSSAFVSFDAPGSAPTTSAYVFFDTLPGLFPPRFLIASSAPSRLQPSNVPVTTTALPASTCDTRVTATLPNSTHAARPQAPDQVALASRTNPRHKGGWQNPTNARRHREVGFGRCHDGVERPESGRQCIGRRRAQVLDPEGDEQPGQGPVPRRVDA